jgi:hypothetical protein
MEVVESDRECEVPMHRRSLAHSDPCSSTAQGEQLKLDWTLKQDNLNPPA